MLLLFLTFWKLTNYVGKKVNSECMTQHKARWSKYSNSTGHTEQRQLSTYNKAWWPHPHRKWPNVFICQFSEDCETHYRSDVILRNIIMQLFVVELLPGFKTVSLGNYWPVKHTYTQHHSWVEVNAYFPSVHKIFLFSWTMNKKKWVKSVLMNINPSTWQVWHIDMMTRQHDCDAGVSWTVTIKVHIFIRHWTISQWTTDHIFYFLLCQEGKVMTLPTPYSNNIPMKAASMSCSHLCFKLLKKGPVCQI